ncbi:MAG: hypothetical protein U0168_31260 [Nannocystaceae bacterium]
MRSSPAAAQVRSWVSTMKVLCAVEDTRGPARLPCSVFAMKNLNASKTLSVPSQMNLPRQMSGWKCSTAACACGC